MEEKIEDLERVIDLLSISISDLSRSVDLQTVMLNDLINELRRLREKIGG